MAPTRVRVNATRRGGWQVTLPNSNSPIACETLDEARRVAYLCAARTHPCELLICDAYHRVLVHELLDGGELQPEQQTGALLPS